MPRKITNMESGVEMKLYGKYDITRMADISYQLFDQLIEDETVETPPPTFSFNGELYWKDDAVEVFKRLGLEDKLADANLQFTKGDLIARAVKAMERIERNVDDRRRKIDYRDASNKARAIKEFVTGLSNYGIPSEEEQKMRTIINSLHVKAGSPV
jgi:hypothetical protein